MKPLIGVSSGARRDDGALVCRVDARYLDAVRRAGGVPVILPLFRSRAEVADVLARVDGVLMTGGPDINPKRWGDKLDPKAKLMEPAREESDFTAIEATLAADKPMLAVCLGCQELNVALGGSLHQHLPRVTKLEHRDGVRHGVEIRKKTRLSDIVRKTTIKVLSYHHQGIDRLAKSLVASAHASDDIVEAVESPKHRFVVGVQWHPERMTGSDALFDALVSASARR